MPLAPRVAPVVEVEEPSRALVASYDVDHVAQIDRRTGCGRRHGDVADLLLVRELARRVHRDVLAGRFQASAADGDVSCAQHVGEAIRLYPVGREPLLRVVEKHLLRTQSRPIDLRDRRDRLDPLRDLIREVVQLAIRVLVAGDCRELRLRLARITDDHRRPRIGVKLRRMKTLGHEGVHAAEDLVVGQPRRRVESHEPWSVDRPQILDTPAGGEVLVKGSRLRFDSVRCDRFREADDDREAGARGRGTRARADFADRGGHLVRAEPDFDVARRRARDGEHECRRVPEVLHEVDRTRAVRQVRDPVELQLDVVELLADLGLPEVLVELDVHDRDAGARDRLDLRDLGVLGHFAFDLLRDELLDALGARARPVTERHCQPHADLRVLALRHLVVAVDAPDACCDKEHPRHVAGLDERSRRVARVRDHLRIGLSVRHWLCSLSIRVG